MTRQELFCDECGSSLLNGNLGRILKLPDKKRIKLCKGCNRKRKGGREPESKSSKMLIVPVRKNTFEKILKEGIYAYPTNYGWKLPEYIGFYRLSPVKALTHYSEIKSVKKDVPYNQIYPNLGGSREVWAKSDTVPLNVVDVGRLLELKTPIHFPHRLWKRKIMPFSTVIAASQDGIFKTYQ